MKYSNSIDKDIPMRLEVNKKSYNISQKAIIINTDFMFTSDCDMNLVEILDKTQNQDTPLSRSKTKPERKNRKRKRSRDDLGKSKKTSNKPEKRNNQTRKGSKKIESSKSEAKIAKVKEVSSGSKVKAKKQLSVEDNINDPEINKEIKMSDLTGIKRKLKELSKAKAADSPKSNKSSHSGCRSTGPSKDTKVHESSFESNKERKSVPSKRTSRKYNPIVPQGESDRLKIVRTDENHDENYDDQTVAPNAFSEGQNQSQKI